MIPMPSAELIIVFVRSHFDVKTRPNEKKSNRRHSSVCMHEGNKCEILFILRLHNKDANAFLNQWCEWCALSVPFYYYFPLNFFFVLFFGCGKRNSTRINRIIRASPSNNDGARNCWFNHLQNLWHDHSSSYFISTLLPSSSREKKKKNIKISFSFSNVIEFPLKSMRSIVLFWKWREEYIRKKTIFNDFLIPISRSQRIESFFFCCCIFLSFVHSAVSQRSSNGCKIDEKCVCVCIETGEQFSKNENLIIIE